MLLRARGLDSSVRPRFPGWHLLAAWRVRKGEARMEEVTDEPLYRDRVCGIDIGKAQMAGFKPVRIGLMLAGLEVPHVHFHVVPIRGLHDLDFGNQDPNPDPAMMDRAAITIQEELRRLGFSEFVAEV